MSQTNHDTVSFGEYINNFIDKLPSIPILGGLVSNSISTIIIMILLVLVIISLNYSNIFRENGYKAFVKTSLYLFMFLYLVMYVHNKLMYNKVSKMFNVEEQKNIFTNVSQIPLNEEIEPSLESTMPVPSSSTNELSDNENLNQPSAQISGGNKTYDSLYNAFSK